MSDVLEYEDGWSCGACWRRAPTVGLSHLDGSRRCADCMLAIYTPDALELMESIFPEPDTEPKKK